MIRHFISFWAWMLFCSIAIGQKKDVVSYSMDILELSKNKQKIMAKELSKVGIVTGNDIKAPHVTQSVDAFTGLDAYDITISGSLEVTGSISTDSTVYANALSPFEWIFSMISFVKKLKSALIE